MKDKVDVFICIDGILIHEKNTKQIYTWFKESDDIKIIKSERKVEEVLNSL